MIKFSKERSKLLAFMLVASLLFNSGCLSLSKKDSSDNLSSETLEEIMNYEDFFANYKVTYKLEDYLLTDKEMDSIISSSNLEDKCYYTFDGDLEALEKIIEQNTKEYTKEYPEYKNYFYISQNMSYEEYDVRSYFKLAFNACLESLSENTNNINEDMHRLETLKIVVVENECEKSYSNGYLLSYYEPKNNVIYVYMDMIKAIAKENSDAYVYGETYDLETLIRAVLKHELNHVLQSKCSCHSTQGDSITNLIYGKYISFLIEASAESELYNYGDGFILPNYKQSDYLYGTERDAEGLLLLLALMDENNINDYYDAIFDTDLEALFDFFQAESVEEKKTLLKMIYIMDAELCRNDFAVKYYGGNKIKDITVKDLMQDLGYPQMAEICRISLSNLLRYTEENDDFSLKDNLVMFGIIKNTVVKDAYVIDFGENKFRTRVYDEDFINDINELVSKYEEYLCFKYNLTKEELDELISDTNNTLLDIKNYVLDDGYYLYDETYDEYICNRFPLIKPIIYSGFYYDDYNAYLEKSSKEYEPKLKNENR